MAGFYLEDTLQQSTN